MSTLPRSSPKVVCSCPIVSRANDAAGSGRPTAICAGAFHTARSDDSRARRHSPAAVILTPKQKSSALPILLVRTPYGVPEDEKTLDSGLYDDLIADGYIFVIQNIRGRFKSEGQFVRQRPVRDKSNPKSVDEGTDAYDTIDWLVKNVPSNNGRVGMWGISYPGWLVTQALLEPHPALKAASEQASPDDMFVNDDFHHNGAFRLSYGFE